MIAPGGKNLALRSVASVPKTGCTTSPVVESDGVGFVDLLVWIMYGTEIIFTKTSLLEV